MYEPLDNEEVKDLLEQLKEKSNHVFSLTNVPLFLSTKGARKDLNIKLSNIVYGIERLQKQLSFIRD